MSLISFAEKACPRMLRPTFDWVRASPLGRKVVVGAFWSVLGSGISKLLTFLALIIVARILGRQTNGEFGLIRSTAAAFVAFSAFGMGITATKYIAELLAKDKERVGRIIALSYLFTIVSALLVSMVFYLSAPWICQAQLGAPHLVGVMRWGALLMFLTTFMGTQYAVMTGFQDFRGLAVAAFLGGLAAFPIYVFGAWRFGLKGVIAGAVVSIGLSVLINSFLIYRNTKRFGVRYAFRDAYRELPLLWKSNIPIVLISLLNVVLALVGQMMLAVRPDGTAELGVYHVAMSFQAIMMFLPQQLSPVFFPILSEWSAAADSKRYWNVVRKGWLLNVVVTLIVVLPFALFPSRFMGLAGADYVDGGKTLLACVLVVLVSSGSSAAYQVLLSRGRNWIHVLISLASGIVFFVTASLLFANGFGATGLFLTHAITGTVYGLSCLLLIAVME